MKISPWSTKLLQRFRKWNCHSFNLEIQKNPTDLHKRVRTPIEIPCTIINHISLPYRAGSKTHSGRLNIYGPPTARTFPKDLKAVEGLESILQCPMGGYPLGKHQLYSLMFIYSEKAIKLEKISQLSMNLLGNVKKNW